jgi:Ca2+-binding EF-hand superfamily protein
LTQADLAEGLRIASPTAFHTLHSEGSLDSELAEEFAAMDANGDGKISFEEFKTALSGPVSYAAQSSKTVPVTAH